MKAEAFRFYSDQYLTEIGLVIFMTVFIGVTLWVLRKGSQDHYKKMSLMPLEGDSKP